jgi:hypothetical protein
MNEKAKKEIWQKASVTDTEKTKNDKIRIKFEKITTDIQLKKSSSVNHINRRTRD